MKSHSELTHFAGFDWAKDHHDVCILDRQGQIVAQFRFPHTGTGWQEWREKIRAYPALGVAVETSRGAAVEQLLASGVTVYPVHPKAAKAYRQRLAPSGTKDDVLDAWALADALRLDGAPWRALSPQDAIVEELRLLCRDEEELIGQRTALVNQLQAALREYYPAALEAFEDWTQPYTWAFVKTFATPQQLVSATLRRRQTFLHTHKLWRPGTAEERLAIFARADQFCGGAVVTRAKSRLALARGAATVLASRVCIRPLRTICKLRSPISQLPSPAPPNARSTAAYCSGVAFIKRHNRSVGIAARIRSLFPATQPTLRAMQTLHLCVSCTRMDKKISRPFRSVLVAAVDRPQWRFRPLQSSIFHLLPPL